MFRCIPPPCYFVSGSLTIFFRGSELRACVLFCVCSLVLLVSKHAPLQTHHVLLCVVVVLVQDPVICQQKAKEYRPRRCLFLLQDTKPPPVVKPPPPPPPLLFPRPPVVCVCVYVRESVSDVSRLVRGIVLYVVSVLLAEVGLRLKRHTHTHSTTRTVTKLTQNRYLSLSRARTTHTKCWEGRSNLMR